MEKKYLFKLLLIGVLLLCYSLNTTAQKKTYLNPKDTMDLKYEKFDMEFYNKNKDNKGNFYCKSVKEGKTEVEILVNEVYDDIQETECSYPYFFTKIKFF